VRTVKEMRDDKKRKPGRPGVVLLAAVLVSGVARAGDDKDSAVESVLRSLELTGYAQVLAVDWDRDVDSFSIRRARVALAGEVVKNLRFRLNVDFAKSPTLLDAEISFEPCKIVGFKLGQFRLPFSLESICSSSDLDTVNRSPVVDTLAPGRDNAAFGRDIGIAFYGSYSVVGYMFGLFNGSGINKTDTNSHKDWGGRIVVHPLRCLSVGGSLYRGKQSASPEDPLLKRDKEGLEAALAIKRFSFKTEYIHARDDLVAKAGWYVQAGYFAFRGRIEAVLKYGSLDLDRAVSGDATRVITAGVNWLVMEKVRLQVNYEIHRLETGVREKSGLLAQLQAGF
jgi:phosphate-selective porin OprO/OprP